MTRKQTGEREAEDELPYKESQLTHFLKEEVE